MPRYFFDVLDGDLLVPDGEGVVLSDDMEARAEAVRLAGAVLGEGLGPSFWAGKPWRLELKDEAGKPLVTLKFAALEAAA